MLLNAADKALWRLALPMIFSNITVPLLGLVDTAVIGHLDSPVYLGGVAVGATATSFLFMLLLFLRMSTTGLTAQAWGAKDPQRLARALVQDASMLIMDEPTASLDYGNSFRVMQRIESLSAGGYSVIFSPHEPNQAFRYATYIINNI